MLNNSENSTRDDIKEIVKFDIVKILKNKIKEKKKEKVLENYEIDFNTSFVSDLGFDSLDIVEVAMSFEDHFNIELTDESCQNFKTVGEYIDYIVNVKDERN